MVPVGTVTVGAAAGGGGVGAASAFDAGCGFAAAGSGAGCACEQAMTIATATTTFMRASFARPLPLSRAVGERPTSPNDDQAVSLVRAAPDRGPFDGCPPSARLA